VIPGRSEALIWGYEAGLIATRLEVEFIPVKHDPARRGACMVVAACFPGSGRGRAPEERASARAAGRSGDPATGPPWSRTRDLGVRIETVKALVEIGTQYSLDP